MNDTFRLEEKINTNINYCSSTYDAEQSLMSYTNVRKDFGVSDPWAECCPVNYLLGQKMKTVF